MASVRLLPGDLDVDVCVLPGFVECSIQSVSPSSGGTITSALMSNSVTPLTAARDVPVSIDSMLMPRCESPAAMSWMIPSWSAPCTSMRYGSHSPNVSDLSWAVALVVTL